MGGLDKRYVIATLAVGAVGFFAPMLLRLEHFNFFVYMLAANLLGFELLDISIRLWLGRRNARSSKEATTQLFAARLKPYAIVMSVHNLESRLGDYYESFERFKHHIWLIDDCSTDNTASQLRAAGWRCHSASVNRKKPGAIRDLLTRLPKEIETVIVFDPDCTPLETSPGASNDLEAAVQRFQASGASACCPRIHIRDEGLLSVFQSLECEFAFQLGRRGMSPHSITSGVAIYSRKALEAALAEHSLSVYAEDLENSLILLGSGQTIYYEDRLIVQTEAKTELSAWISQRVGWSFGLMKVMAERHREILRIAKFNPWSFYNFAVYMGLMSIALFPIKLAGVVLLSISFVNGFDNLFALNLVADNAMTDPMYFAATYLCYTFLISALFLLLRPPLRMTSILIALPFFVFYPILHCVPITIGYLNWISMRVFRTRLYDDHFMSQSELDGAKARVMEPQN